MDFTPEEKEAVFDKIYKAYFERNFGSMSKCDFETLLFSEYIDHCRRNNTPYDDYSISKALGITQSKVRTLKEKKELKYPIEDFDWEKEFAKAVEKAKYFKDNKNKYVTILIEDINVMNEIRHRIETNGWYDECTLNKKVFRIRIECFLELCLEDADLKKVFSDNAKKAIKEIRAKDNAIKDFIDNFSKEGLKNLAVSASKAVFSEVLKRLPFTEFAKSVIDALLK